MPLLMFSPPPAGILDLVQVIPWLLLALALVAIVVLSGLLFLSLVLPEEPEPPGGLKIRMRTRNTGRVEKTSRPEPWKVPAPEPPPPRSRWDKFAVQTENAPWSRIEAEVRELYRLMELGGHVPVIRFASPLQGCIASFLVSHWSRPLRPRLAPYLSPFENPDWSTSIAGQVRNLIRAGLLDLRGGDPLETTVQDVVSRFRETGINPVFLGKGYPGEPEAQIRRSLMARMVSGQTCRCLYGAYEGLRLDHLRETVEEMGQRGDMLYCLEDLAEHTSWIWPYRDVCIVTDRPEQVHFDELERLHHESGPALTFADGWALHALRGVRVPRWVVEHPEDITLETVLDVRDVRTRRVMIARAGIERMVESGELTLVDRDGGHLLCEVPPAPDDQDGEPLVLVRITCPTTGTVHVEQVPPVLRTCREAVIWATGIDPESYVSAS